jgi:hypothetical protein
VGAAGLVMAFFLAKLHIANYSERAEKAASIGLSIDPPIYFNSIFLALIALATGVTAIVLTAQWASDRNTSNQDGYLGNF